MQPTAKVKSSVSRARSALSGCGTRRSCPACLCAPTISTGPCPPTVAGPYAAWMPRKSLQGRTCGVSREGGRQGPRSQAAC
ncbi:hypothetical protein XarjCFBP7653_02605 [Xanthomonas arboricola]|nr:hypothetical protein XarjCFBP7653_02605 [Xanthomonas arboricola]